MEFCAYLSIWSNDVLTFARGSYLSHWTKKTVFHDAAVKLKLEKCNYYLHSNDYLQHMIPPCRNKVLSCIRDVILDFSTLSDIKDLCPFKSLENAISKLVVKFRIVAAPLTKKLSNGEKMNSATSIDDGSR